MSVEIEYKGKTTIVDEDVYNKKIKGHNVWITKITTPHKDGTCRVAWYAWIHADKKNWYLHRYILDLNDREQHTDHINGDTLDNRKSNLRVVDNRRNQQNRKGLPYNNKSGFRGVSLMKLKNARGREFRYWVACIKDNNGKQVDKNFSILEHGSDKAFKLACEYRKQLEEKFGYLKGADESRQ